MICNWFKKKERQQRHEGNISEAPEKKSLRILVLPGHQPEGGAQTYLPHIKEDKWNREVVAKVEMMWDRQHTLVRGCDYRTEKSYSAYVKRIKKFCKQNKVDVMLEVHLNAAGVPMARGCEALIHPNDTSGFYAFKLVSLFSVRFRILLRGYYKNIQGVKGLSKKARGGHILHELMKVGTHAIIWEPFFCDYKSIESEQFLEQPDYGTRDMAKFLIEGLGSL